jgi:hypothetical protein
MVVRDLLRGLRDYLLITRARTSLPQAGPARGHAVIARLPRAGTGAGYWTGLVLMWCTTWGDAGGGPGAVALSAG